jgi:hypothetical protein
MEGVIYGGSGEACIYLDDEVASARGSSGWLRARPFLETEEGEIELAAVQGSCRVLAR